MGSIVRSGLLVIIGSVMGSMVVLVLVIIGLLYFFQERMAFQPQGPPYPRVDDTVKVDYSAADGQQLFAYLIGEPSCSSGLLLAFHGNADMAARQIGWALETVRRTGLSVLLAEYRGYAGLPGAPTYAGTQLDAEAAYKFARQNLDVPRDKIAFFGHSLGTAIAAELAALHEPSNLILQSPFTSARDMTKVLIGRRASEFTWSRVSRIHFDTLEKVRTLDAPVSVAHGSIDRLIPLHMGRQVFEAARKKGEWLVVVDASHNDVATKGGEAYWDWMLRSLGQVR